MQILDNEMSRLALYARGAFALSVVVSIGMIVYVHQAQEQEQARLHQGVIADLERQRLKREAREARSNGS